MRSFVTAVFLVLAAWTSGQKTPNRLARFAGYWFWIVFLLVAGVICTIADSYLPVGKIAGYSYLFVLVTTAIMYLIAACIQAYTVAYSD